MNKKLYVTTSWDDGHPLDFRVAEVLSEYELPGTFYVPRSAEWQTMSEADIRTLATGFEIGAHTMEHAVLTEVDATKAKREITDSRYWLESVLGVSCQMFCFPRGKFRDEHLSAVRESGYLGARTVEMLSTALPSLRNGVFVMPTTIQAYPHVPGTYAKNAARRKSPGNLWRYIRHGSGRDWHQLAESVWQEARETGGVFHLWGHSWEVESTDQWHRLEQVCRFLHERRDESIFVTNRELCNSAASALSD